MPALQRQAEAAGEKVVSGGQGAQAAVWPGEAKVPGAQAAHATPPAVTFWRKLAAHTHCCVRMFQFAFASAQVHSGLPGPVVSPGAQAVQLPAPARL